MRWDVWGAWWEVSLRPITRRQPIRAASFLVTAILSLPTNAGSVEVEGLLEQCSDDSSQDFQACLGYVAGIKDMLAINGVLLTRIVAAQSEKQIPLRQLAICQNGVVTNGQAVAAFVSWARKHPEKSNGLAAFGVAEALIDVWPCRWP